MEEHEYVHIPLRMEVRSISGGYVLEREVRIMVDDKEVLYVTGVGVVDSACCGVGGSRYALVPGILLDWKFRQNQDGLAVSRVARIADPDLRRKVAQEIRSREKEIEVQFM